QDDYRRAGIVTAVEALGPEGTATVIKLTLWGLLPVGLLTAAVLDATWVAAAGLFVAWTLLAPWRWTDRITTAGGRRVLLDTIVYLTAALGVISSVAAFT